MSFTKLLLTDQTSTQVRICCTWSALSILQKLSGLPRSQSNCPVKASRLQLTHSSEQAAGAHVTSTTTAINPKEQREGNIWFQESWLSGQQLRPEQCNERSGSQRQSEPLVFEGANHISSAAAPINRAFSQKPTSADPVLAGAQSEVRSPGQMATALLLPRHLQRPVPRP